MEMSFVREPYLAFFATALPTLRFKCPHPCIINTADFGSLIQKILNHIEKSKNLIGMIQQMLKKETIEVVFRSNMSNFGGFGLEKTRRIIYLNSNVCFTNFNIFFNSFIQLICIVHTQQQNKIVPESFEESDEYARAIFGSMFDVHQQLMQFLEEGRDHEWPPYEQLAITRYTGTREEFIAEKMQGEGVAEKTQQFSQYEQFTRNHRRSISMLEAKARRSLSLPDMPISGEVTERKQQQERDDSFQMLQHKRQRSHVSLGEVSVVSLDSTVRVREADKIQNKHKIDGQEDQAREEKKEKVKDEERDKYKHKDKEKKQKGNWLWQFLYCSRCRKKDKKLSGVAASTVIEVSVKRPVQEF